MVDSRSDSNIFSVRIVSIDYYMASPVPDIDICYSSFQGGNVHEVPVIRIYGSTPAGQKTCLHVHRALPYLYVSCSDLCLQPDQEADVCANIIPFAVEKALKLKGKAGSKRQHVHSCNLVRAKKFYGYHSSEELFAKIYLYYPQDVNRTANLLLEGAIFDKIIQPHESHIPFLLQFLVDYNLYGMGHLHVSKMKFRNPVPDVLNNRQHTNHIRFQADSSGNSSSGPPIWLSSTIPDGWVWQSCSQLYSSSSTDFSNQFVKRQSTCELEGDAVVDDILNQQSMLFSSLSQTHEDVKMVQSLIPIWEEEYQRTGMHGSVMISDPAKPLPLDVLRNLANDFDSEIKLMESLRVSDSEDSSPCTPTENQIPFSRSVRSLPDEGNSNPKKGSIEYMVPLEASDRIRVILSQESSHLKAEDEEALGLLKWLASSQAEEDINSDDELVRETILSPLLPTTTINKVLEKANLDFESESHKECQDILDSVEESPNDDQNMIPSSYKSSEKTTNSEQSLQESIDRDMGSSSTSNLKRKRSLWGSLPLSFTHKVNDEVKIETNRFTEDGKTSTVVKCSVRDLMRRKRCYRIEGENYNVKPNDSISLIYGKLPLSSGSVENLSPSEGLEVKNSKKIMQSHNSDSENPCVKDTDLSMKLEESFVEFSSMARCTKEIIKKASSSANEETSDKFLDRPEVVRYFRKKPDDSSNLYILAPADSPPVRDSVHEWLSSNDTVQGQVVDECLPYFEDVKCGLDDLNYRRKFAMGVPTYYHNDGSYLYMLTPVFSPPSPHNVHKWLLSEKSGHSDNQVGPYSSPPNDCNGPLPESGSISDSKANINQVNQIIQESNSAKTQNKADVSEVKQGSGFSQDISQISGPDGKSKLTPLSQVGFRDPASVGCGQQLTIISIEVQAESRGDLRSDPRFDAINLIALVVQEDDDYMRDAYVLICSKIEGIKRNVDGISGCKYLVFSDEKHVLHHFVKIISSLDPDILMGWDIQGNSIGFLAERASYLGIGLLNNISRTPSPLNSADSDEIQDKGIAKNDSSETLNGNSVRVEDAIIEDEWGRTHASGLHVGGRIVLNVWRLMRSEVKLNMYTAEAVAEGVLRRKVPHIHCKVLTDWFSSGPARARFRCIDYVFKRAKLNLQLVNQLDMINRTSELARVFGIDFFSVLSRGSQYRVESMLLRLAHTQNYLAVSPGPHQVASQPAMECIPLVMEPKSGFYADPVVVLDFQSLYPSMIIAYNLCFSTCLGKVTPSSQNVLGVLSSYTPDPNVLQDLKREILSTPNGVLYVPSKVRRGVVPRLLDEILSTRIMVKQSMKKLTPSQQILNRIFNARQLALKLIANVTYGYTAAGFSGRMPCAELADSIVQCGRRTLERAISFVNTHHKWKAKVIYGDTDSMFVQLKGRTVKEAFKIGYEIAAAVSAMNPRPVTLKMEKVYYPCFLLTKKRYVGYNYESPDQLKPSFDAKGVETVRRDTCPAVSKTMEKSLKLFFEHQDISKVKSYLLRQWTRILSGRISIQDFIFAKEVRLGTYSTRLSSLPPAAIVATKAMRVDPRAEPKYGDRIPYVVVHGEPGARLVDMVVDPLDLLAVDSPFRLNDLYYINKQIIPALQRVFGLVGAELTQWFLDMPRPVREGVGKRNFLAPNSNNYQRARIDFYYLSRHCVVCGQLVQGSSHLCDNCSKNNGGAATAIIGRSWKLEREIQHLAAICRQCGGGDWVTESGVKCTSLACCVLYERRKAQKELRSISAVATQLGLYPPCMVEWF